MPSAASPQHLGALFSYIPEEDGLHPCPEAGITFRCGDILELVNLGDEHWWQMRLVMGSGNGNGNGRGDDDKAVAKATRMDENVGLAPSSKLQERRWMMGSRSAGAETDVSSLRRKTSDGSGSKRVRKVMYETRQSEEFEVDDLKSYEAVALLYPRPGLMRLLILVRPAAIGRNELK